jgi:hypothetical protein
MDEQDQQQIAAAMPPGAPANQGQLMPVTPRPLPRHNCQDEKQEFMREFDEDVIELVRKLRRKYPYRQTIKWSIELGDDSEHSVNIVVKSRS